MRTTPAARCGSSTTQSCMSAGWPSTSNRDLNIIEPPFIRPLNPHFFDCLNLKPALISGGSCRFALPPAPTLFLATRTHPHAHVPRTAPDVLRRLAPPQLSQDRRLR